MAVEPREEVKGFGVEDEHRGVGEGKDGRSRGGGGGTS